MRFQRPPVPVIVGVIGIVLFAAILRFGNLCGTPVARFVWFCANSTQIEPLPVLSCNRACHSQDDCPESLHCDYFGTGDHGPVDLSNGMCFGDICQPAEYICHCDGPDYVCPDQTYPNDYLCVPATGLCSCVGQDLSCPRLGITWYETDVCAVHVFGCGCSGPDRVCSFGGDTQVSWRNAPECVSAPPATACYQLCDPAAPNCDPGLTCTRTEDGLNRCIGGVDSRLYDCTTWPSFSRCYQACDPATALCDPDLSCLPRPGSEYFRCVGGVDTAGTDCTFAPTSFDSSTPIASSVSEEPGVCNDTCDPQAPTCQAGLSCLAKSAGSSQYICWNSAICTASDVTPVVTEGPVSTEAPQQCGAGWLPSGGCVCCGSSLVCADGTVAQFNPACMSDEPAAVCGDGVCGGGETCWTCSADCGPC